MQKTNLSRIETQVDRQYLPLFHFAERLCGSPTAALLLAQRTFRLALDRSRSLPVPANIRAWLFSILFHEFLEIRSHLRHDSTEAARFA